MPHRSAHSVEQITGQKQLGTDQAVSLETSPRALHSALVSPDNPGNTDVSLKIISGSDRSELSADLSDGQRIACFSECPRDGVAQFGLRRGESGAPQLPALPLSRLAFRAL
jgi:hypothetical protein